MRKVTQLTLTLASKPGVLAKLCRTLGADGINIEGICAPEVSGTGKVRLVVADPARAQALLKAAKIRCGEEEALAVPLENRPAALAEVADKLAKARLNIRCAYATTPGHEGPATVILSVSNTARAMAVLSNLAKPERQPSGPEVGYNL